MIKLKKEAKADMISKLQDYLYKEWDEEIGDLAAEIFLEYIGNELGPYFYNQGVEDARALLNEKLLDLEEEYYSLEKPLRKRKLDS
ncbi:DUF2164 domain-containing protein [Bacillus sp. FJAT-42376]|uniref:DUF2164 domain-containing protein n=1 Tax=Bacillus sp. FJAT-42376 TaxID=2014076 RepID=UPI000F4ED50E|nr:DUF2164 domain-containing protein [Bacillus sp. FJAT-42376]AZB44428.1 DUF2164 domain-containing protein [Bacillus sp. FJAT-42376]